MRILKGLTALLVLVTLVIGVPLALIGLQANPLPGLANIADVIGRPDYGGIFLTSTLMPAIAWLAWAWFTLSLLVEIPAAIRGIQAPRIGALTGAQGFASLLVAAIIGMGAGPAMAAPTAHAAETVSITQAETSGATQADEADQAPSTAEHERYTVRSGDSLWGIAETRLGDGLKYKQIAELNYDRTQPDGRTLTPNNHQLHPGWELLLPTPDQPAPATTTYTVQPGDNLSSIAATQLGDPTKITALINANPNLTNPDLIHPGDTLTLPTGGMSPSQEAADTTETITPAATPEPAEKPAPAPEPAPEPATPPATPPAAAEQPTTPTTDTEQQATQPTPAQAPDLTETSADQTDEAESEASPLATAGGIGAFLAAGLLTLLGARRLHQRRRRKAGETTPAPTGDAAAVEAKLREVEDPITAESIDQALRYINHWARTGNHELPELFCARATETTLVIYLAEPVELPAPFIAVDEDNTVWQVTPTELPDLDTTPVAPYPGLVTLGQDEHGTHVLTDIEYIGALNVSDKTGRSHEILNALAVELGMSPWSEQLQVSLVGLAAGLPEVAGSGRIRHFDDVDALITRLRGQAAESRAQLAATGHDSLRQVRADATGHETVPPEIIVLALTPTDEQLDEITDLINELPRIGIAAITNDHALGDWILDVDTNGTATLQPVGVTLNPQRVSDAEHDAIIDLLATASAPSVPGEKTSTEITLDLVETGFTPTLVDTTDNVDEDAEALAAAEAALDLDNTDPEDDEQAEETTETIADTTSEPDEEQPAAADLTADIPADITPEPEEQPDAETVAVPELEAAEPATAEPATEETPDLEAVANDSGQAETTEDGMSPEAVPAASRDDDSADAETGELLAGAAGNTDAPMLRLLGPVELLGARGPAPTTPSGEISQTKIARYTSVVAYLAMHETSTLEDFHHAFWPNVDPYTGKAETSRNRLSSDVRKYLGQDDDGAYFYPHATGGQYRLDDRVTSDWQIFQNLVGTSPQAATTERLVAALKLVRGAPFEKTAAKHWLWNDNVRSEMIDTICDVAHELVQRAAAHRNPTLAKLGSRVGCLVDPANEQMWRNAMLAEHMDNNRAGVEEVAKKLNDYLDSFGDDYEPEEETQDLLDQLRSRHGYKIAG